MNKNYCQHKINAIKRAFIQNVANFFFFERENNYSKFEKNFYKKDVQTIKNISKPLTL